MLTTQTFTGTISRREVVPSSLISTTFALGLPFNSRTIRGSLFYVLSGTLGSFSFVVFFAENHVFCRKTHTTKLGLLGDFVPKHIAWKHGGFSQAKSPLEIFTACKVFVSLNFLSLMLKWKASFGFGIHYLDILPSRLKRESPVILFYSLTEWVWKGSTQRQERQ